jgi:serine/threonine protein kinase/tetratricopeptide (TPR) repeat protein
MDVERWQKVNEIFHSALQQTAERRRGFLMQACANDTELLAEVESLLFSYEESSSFIQGSAFDHAVDVLAQSDTPQPGQRIGCYKIIREIGRGGMGAVLLALRDDEEFEKEVAIKIIKRGMDTDYLLDRFRNERQILARLDHANIARLLDGGTTESGLPYFVMEYIEGQPIDEYCDEKKLSVVERLKLFRKVCAAVHYAHQNLVIHRDIKPSNILVTEDDTPKLLDFGIAKILTPDSQDYTQETATMMRMMTPEYASPEQVRGDHITTASDVYSLGVVLYELLTGRSPYRYKGRSPLEVLSIVSNNDPEKPSTAIFRLEESTRSLNGAETQIITAEDVSLLREGSAEKLRRRLSGDLDNIILKAMRKEKERRYASVERLSDDIRNYLHGLPVSARKDTFSYRTLKFISRNKAAVIAATLVLLTLIGGIIATAWQAKVAHEQRMLARADREKARDLARKVLFDYHDAIGDLPGSVQVRNKLAQDMVEYLNSFAHEAASEPALQGELADAYERVSSVLGGSAYANLGDTDKAIENLKNALRIRENLLKADPQNPQLRMNLANSYRKYAALLSETPKLDEALDSYRQSVTLAEALVNEDSNNASYKRLLALNCGDLGSFLTTQGKWDEALANQLRALNIHESFAKADPRNAETRRALSVCDEAIGQIMLQEGNAAGALEWQRKALELRKALVAENPINAEYKRILGSGYYNAGVIYSVTQQTSESLDSYRKSAAIATELAGKDPENATLKADASIAHLSIGFILRDLGNAQEASENFRRALQLREELFNSDPHNYWKRWLMIEAAAKTASSLAQSGNAAEALNYSKKTLDLIEETASESDNADFRTARATAYLEIADAYTRLSEDSKISAGERRQHLQAARQLYQQSLDIFLDMQSRGTLSSLYAYVPEAFRTKMARCDAALTK